MTGRGNYLTQSNTAVVRWNTLVPVRTKTLGEQAIDGSFCEISILETSTGKNDFRLSDLSRDGDDRLRQHVVKLRGHHAKRFVTRNVIEQSKNRRLPIDDTSWYFIFQIERIRLADAGLNGELQFHRRLTFEIRPAAQTNQRSDGIE